MHSFLSRDGILPVDFRAICHEELTRYPTLTRRDGFVRDIRLADQRFEILVGDSPVTSRKVIIALGLVDALPKIDGLAENWGKGVHSCPYCDGYEHRDTHWGVLANQPEMLDHALFLRGWTERMTVFAAFQDVPAEKRDALQSAGIQLIHAAVSKVVGGDGHSLRGIELADGSAHQVESLWVRPSQSQTPLVERLGLRLREDGAIWRDERSETSIPGMLAAGDCAAGPAQQAILATADGARTALSTTHSLVTAAR
jgi:thioredoxin reductase